MRNSGDWKRSGSLAEVIRLSGRYCFVRWMTSPTPYPEHRSILSVSPSCPFGSSGKARRINNLPDLFFQTRDLIKVRFGRLSSIIAGGHCGDVANGTGMNGVDAHRRKLDGEVSHHAGDSAIRHRDPGRFRIGPIARRGVLLGLVR